MTKISIKHISRYRYHTKVRLWDHLFRLTPRHGPSWTIEQSTITCEPSAAMHQIEDSSGNLVTYGKFAGAQSDFLEVTSELSLVRSATMYPIFQIARSAANYPFQYSTADSIHLQGFLAQSEFGPSMGAWLAQFMAPPPMDTLSLLRAINRQINQEITYQPRWTEGVYDWETTLNLKAATCRDMATLFACAARALGFAVRLTTGYLLNIDDNLVGDEGNTALHAWAEVYVPGAGWIAFDPTNDIMGDYLLVPLASAADLSETGAIEGQFGSDDFVDTVPWVNIEISAEN